MDRLTKILISVICAGMAGLIAIICFSGRTITVKIENPVAVGGISSSVSTGETSVLTEDNNVVSEENTDSSSETVTDTSSASVASDNAVSSSVSSSSATEKTATSDGTMNKEQIVNLYNTAVNKVKSEAKTLTRNYHHLTIPEDTLELPSAIQGIGKSAISTFVKGDDNPQSWTTKEDITTVFPVGGESYSSHLTASMVNTAECKDNGSTYSVTLNLFDDAITSPAKGSGYAGVFNTTSASTFSEINIPTVTFNQVDINGINGSIKCTVDKATGHVTDITFANTDVLKLNVKVVVSTIDCKMEMVQEDNYKIEY